MRKMLVPMPIHHRSAPGRRAQTRRRLWCGRMSSGIAAPQYALTEEQPAFRDAVRQLVAERIAPRAAEIDAQAEYPWGVRRLLADHDVLGLPFDEEHGGTATGTLMLNVAVEEIARACASS